MYSEQLHRTIEPTRHLYSYKFFKKRRDFEVKQLLSEKDASDTIETINSILDKLQQQKLVTAQTKTFSFQAVQGRHSRATNTEYKIQRNKAVQTEMGVRQVHVGEDEQERLQTFLETVVPQVEEALCNNETIDIFFNDLNFGGRKSNESQFLIESSELAVIKELKSFEYESCKGKSVSCVRFKEPHSAALGLVGVSFKENLNFEEEMELQMRSFQSELYLWNYKDFHRWSAARPNPQILPRGHFAVAAGNRGVRVPPARLVADRGGLLQRAVGALFAAQAAEREPPLQLDQQVLERQQRDHVHFALPDVLDSGVLQRHPERGQHGHFLAQAGLPQLAPRRSARDPLPPVAVGAGPQEPAEPAETGGGRGPAAEPVHDPRRGRADPVLGPALRVVPRQKERGQADRRCSNQSSPTSSGRRYSRFSFSARLRWPS